ncbi:MAG: TIGR02391 family protein [Symbiobacteriia bacterium]
MDLLDRIDTASITEEDLRQLEASQPVRPTRWFDYIPDDYWGGQGRAVWQAFPPAIPFSIIDNRIIDLAIKFPRQPDTSLLTGYRRLEDIVRTRTGLDEHGHKLFSQAFLGEKAKLFWVNVSPGEQRGRAELFTGAYMSYRNPRAHREPEESAEGHLVEFLLLNHLYLLEARAKGRETSQG